MQRGITDEQKREIVGGIRLPPELAFLSAKPVKKKKVICKFQSRETT